MMAAVQLAFSCCILQKLSHCWWWKLRYYKNHLDSLDEGSSSLHDVTEAEMLVFLVIIQMGHCIWTNWQAIAKWPTNSIQVYTVALWNRADTCTSFTFCTSQTRMSMTGQTKILTGYGRYKICLNF